MKCGASPELSYTFLKVSERITEISTTKPSHHDAFPLNGFVARLHKVVKFSQHLWISDVYGVAGMSCFLLLRFALNPVSRCSLEYFPVHTSILK